MSDSVMCDPNARLWCGRVSLLCSVCVVLCTMIYQIWSYYFSLVAQMDAYVIESPRVHAFLHACEGVVTTTWNVDCEENLCTFAPTEFKTFVDAPTMFHVNATQISFEGNRCDTVWIWILPW